MDRYEEALKMARTKIKHDKDHVLYENDIFDIFPELAESKDERIRKAIINGMTALKEQGGETFAAIHINDCIAWLEKQEGCEHIKKDWLEHIKQSWYKEGFIDGKYSGGTSKEWTINDTTTLNELIDFLENGTVKLQHDLTRYANWLKIQFTPIEKQGEQKPADKVEPKFKVGDWITDGQLTCKVLGITGKSYELYLHNDDYCHFETDAQSVDEHYYLWTIKDAKKGDILTSISFHSNCTFIFNGLDNWKFDEPNGDRAIATGYCCLTASADKMEFGIQGPDCIEVNTVKPATKIQRDLLEKAMTDAGYRWNPDENKIEKIEQKPDWNKEDEKMLYSAIEYAQTYPAHRNSVVNWLKSLKERYTWKPSDEQMKFLQKCIEAYNEVTFPTEVRVLSSLYNDLKKLRGE